MTLTSRFLTASSLFVAGSLFAQTESRTENLVLLGRIPCELGVVVHLSADEKVAGEYVLKIDKQVFQLRPVETSTGVIRLEDKKAGAVWLQIANKSMLMNQKLGRRMADECMSPTQVAAAQAMKANPVPGLLDAVRPVTASPTVAAAFLGWADVSGRPQ